jgi:pimeloyl-ACP methyl ester carboxylesterase
MNLLKACRAPVRRLGGCQRLSLLLLAGELLAACQVAATEAPSGLYGLIVANGRGGGQYAPGETVPIWAEPRESGWLFDRWVGDTEFLADSQMPHTAVAMPAKPVHLAASYVAVQPWTTQHDSVEGRKVHYYFPSAPTGVIMFFHGSGYAADEWIESEAEITRFICPAVAAGYGFVATESEDRVSREWDLNASPDDNRDLQAVHTMLELFVARGAIAADTPVYAVGVSQGGRFASLAAHELRFAGQAIYVGVGQPDIFAVTTVPTIWCLAQNDPVIDAREAWGNYTRLRSRGVEAAFMLHQPAPLCPDCFLGIAGIDAAESQRLFAEMEAQGYLDAAHFLRENPRFSAWEQDVAGNYPAAVRHDLRHLLWATYAEHEFFSECTVPVLRFFSGQR